MKNAVVNLLMGVALVACLVNAVQWRREAGLHARVDALDKENYDRAVAIQTVESSLKRLRDDVARLGALREEQAATNQVMNAELARARGELAKRKGELDVAQAAAEAAKKKYEEGSQELAALNRQILAQADQVKSANERRTEEVKKFNDVANSYNQLATRYKDLEKTYNDLVAQVKAATGQ